MSRKILTVILAVLCVAGSVVLAIVGVRRASRPAVIEGLTSLGELTLEAYDATIEQDEDGQYTIYYRYIDDKYGEIIFANSVDSEDYYSYEYDRMRAQAAENGEIPEDSEVTKKTSIRRYVYVYPLDGRYEPVFLDRYMGLSDVSDLIDPSPKVSSTYYYIVAGILLIAAGYFFFMVFAGERKETEA